LIGEAAERVIVRSAGEETFKDVHARQEFDATCWHKSNAAKKVRVE
jgi:hypothetical protein